jgi:predicted SprT family Zn-dependent metalloprotease
MATPKRKAAVPQLPLQRKFAFRERGDFFDLRALFEKLNERYFKNKLRGYVIVWGPRRRQRPKTGIVFGSIREEERVIRIHPLLDRAFVPSWFLEYVIYHEMCHAVVPDQFDASGRRKVHHEKFFERERKFRWFRRAKAWEADNLARFLR